MVPGEIIEAYITNKLEFQSRIGGAYLSVRRRWVHLTWQRALYLVPRDEEEMEVTDFFTQ